MATASWWDQKQEEDCAVAESEDVPTIPPVAERRAMQSSFDRLIESNFALQTDVRSLVRVAYVALVVQGLGVVAAASAAVFSALHR